MQEHGRRPLTQFVWQSPDCRSTGATHISFGAPVVWKISKQHIIVFGTCDAEYVAANVATRELRWLQRLFELHLAKLRIFVPLYVDNKGAINIATHNCKTKQRQHIDIFVYHLPTLKETGHLNINHIHSGVNPAYAITNSLAQPQFENHLNKLVAA